MGMKHYPAEFKVDAIALYRSRPGATIKSVARITSAGSASSGSVTSSGLPARASARCLTTGCTHAYALGDGVYARWAMCAGLH